MKETGLPFTGESVRAILEGRKGQTRRVVKGRWLPLVEEVLRINGKWVFDTVAYELTTPFGQVGDRLWVRETWAELDWAKGDVKIHNIDDHSIIYLAEQPDFEWCDGDGGIEFRKDGFQASHWKPSIFMPKWAARLWLEITGLRAERLWEITPKDAVAEGIDGRYMLDVFILNDFRILWDSLNAKRGYPWESNPWVWVISFKRVELTLVPGK